MHRAFTANHLQTRHLRQLPSGLALLLLFCQMLAPRPLWAQGVAPTANAVLSLAVAPGAPNQVLAGVLNSPQPAGVYLSTDGGVAWVNSTPGLPPNISFAAVAYDPRNMRVAYAADGGSGFLYRSVDGGVTWSELPGFKDLLSPTSAVGEIYTTVENGRAIVYAGTRFDGVLRSQDEGETWTRLDAGLAGDARRIRELITFGGALYAGTHNGVYRLPAGAVVWEQVATFPDTGIVYSLWAAENELYAGTTSALYVSTDGAAWSRVPNAPNTVYYDLAGSGRLLVLGTENGLWVGAGDAWTQANVDGVAYTAPIYALANTPRAPRTIYAGTAGDWVLRSDDEGQNFTAVTSLAPLDVRAALATATPTPTLTSTPTHTPTPTNTATSTFTPLPTNTPTATPLPTNTPTPTSSPTSTYTRTPRPTATAAVTATATVTTTVAATPTVTSTVPITLVAPTATPAVTTAAEAATPIAIEVQPLPGSETFTDTAALVAAQVRSLGRRVTEGRPLLPLQDAAAAAVSLPTGTPDRPAMPPDAVATATPSLPPTMTATSTASSTPPPTATPTITPIPTPTPIPIDIVKEVSARLPIVFVSTALLLFALVVTAGIAIVRGPRDI